MRYYSACFFKSGTIVPFFCQPFLYRDTMKDRGQLLQALASAVEKTRKERKLTKTALAHFADLQESYIRGITKGRRNPTVTTIYAICEALDIPPQEFFKRVNAEIDALDGSKSTVPHK